MNKTLKLSVRNLVSALHSEHGPLGLATLKASIWHVGTGCWAGWQKESSAFWTACLGSLEAADGRWEKPAYKCVYCVFVRIVYPCSNMNNYSTLYAYFRN